MSTDDAPSNDDGRATTVQPIEDYPTATIAVVNALSEAEGTDPMTLSEERGLCLYDYIDPDALDAVVASEPEEAGFQIDFFVDDFAVRIENRRVTVYG